MQQAKISANLRDASTETCLAASNCLLSDLWLFCVDDASEVSVILALLAKARRPCRLLTLYVLGPGATQEQFIGSRFA